MLLVLQPYASAYWQAYYWRVPASTVAALVRLVRAVWSKLGRHFAFFFTIPSHLLTRRHDRNDIDDFREPRNMDEDTLKQLEGAKRLPIDPIKVFPRDIQIASGGPNSPILPSPAEHIGQPSSPTTRTTVANDTTVQNDTTNTSSSRLHTRSMSVADVARQGKRLSLNFPIQSASSRPTRPPSWANSSPVLPPIPSPDPSVAPSPTENNFLAVLAAQERRVLELKEELGKAEKELEMLKKQWAQHEMVRKKQDVKRVTQLQPLQTAPSPGLDSGNDSDDIDGSSQWMHKEMERRKHLLSGVKSSNRKVFSGSRHMRTLSLLSPDKTQGPSFPQPPSLDGTDESRPPSATALGLPIPRSTISPNNIEETQRSFTPDSASDSMVSLDLPRLPSDAILQTGKQMATDFKQGLWTFFEDIRQATVGEEAIHGTTPRRRPQSMYAAGPNAKHSNGNLKKQGSRGNLRRSATLKQDSKDPLKNGSLQRRATDLSPPADIGGSFWRENGLEEPRTTTAAKVRPGSRGSTGKTHKGMEKTAHDATDDESWDSWDTPASKAEPSPKQLQAPGMSSNDSVSEVASSARSTPRTSTSSTGLAATTSKSTDTQNDASHGSNRDSIPWPALAKLVTPSHLKRTASHLMSEWERSLTPSPPPGQSPARLSPIPSDSGERDYFGTPVLAAGENGRSKKD
ncbi:hypothetical protein NA57DRAFT_80154 [Rhizodiscina lignyota]|uniref:DUF4048 domain-containing protein n=1 Tax=Rhizodiscina lignyota TaxID=1504668 RepID=A0A9P4I8G1_9PEZI|nr:hypothetical protein NA57DRAFT_80154 [Rhizodiscina lignyota]